jgi:hypothetical protein
VLEAVFILLEFPSPSRRIFIGSHSLPPLWFTVSVLQNDLLDNRDDVLRKTNKEKREYRSLLGEAKEKVVELESLLVDA